VSSGIEEFRLILDLPTGQRIRKAHNGGNGEKGSDGSGGTGRTVKSVRFGGEISGYLHTQEKTGRRKRRG